MAPRLLAIWLLLCACGDNTPGPPDRPFIRLKAPASAAPGAMVPVHVEIEGGAGMTLVIGARGPGGDAPGDGTRFVQSGLAPATSDMMWLGPDGWTDIEIAQAANPETNDLMLALPRTEVGQWLVYGYLRDGNGDVVAIHGASLVVSDEPAIALSIDRVWAMTDDRITARVRTASGGHDVAVVAWLALPDGTELSLPTFQPGSDFTRPLDDRITLVDRDFAALGAGTYRIAARLVDAGTGEYLGAAGAGFTVCDRRGTVTGIVRDEQGAPLGAGASIARVSLMSKSRGYFDERAGDVDASGAFSIDDVPVGSWTATAMLLDDTGMHVSDPFPVQIGCEGPTPIDLGTRLDATQPALDSAMRTLARIAPADAPASSSCSNDQKIKIMYLTHNGGRDDALPIDVIGVDGYEARAKMMMWSPGQTVVRRLDREETLAKALVLAQLVDVPNTETLDALESAFDTDFIYGTEMGKHPGGKPDKPEFHYTIQASYTSVRDGQRIMQPGFYSSDKTPQSPQTIDVINQVLHGRTPGELERDLRSLVQHQPSPRLDLTYQPITPTKKSVLTPATELAFTTRLTDGETCRALPEDIAVDLETAANIHFVADTVMSDSYGYAKHLMDQPPDDSIDLVRASTIIHYQGKKYESNEVEVRWENLGNMQFVPGQVRVPFEATTGVLVTTVRARIELDPVTHKILLKFDPAPNKKIMLSATLGTISSMNAAPSFAPGDAIELTTDSQGKARISFTAGTTAGLARITGKASDPNAMEEPTSVSLMVEPPLRLSLATDPTADVTVNKPLSVVAFADLPNGKRAVGVDVKFEVVSGGGVITTVSGRTDSTGRATALFQAPGTPGTSTVRAYARFAGIEVDKTLPIEVRAACAGCPVTVTASADSCQRNEKVVFHANQVVTWSATGGSIDNGGTFMCGTQGGEWTITAHSVENASATGAKTILIVPTPAEYAAGGHTTSFTVSEADTNYCVQPSMGHGVISIVDVPPPAPNDQVEVHYSFGANCSEAFGVGDIQFYPRIREDGWIIQSIHDAISGCQLVSVALHPFGPGIAGLQGSFFRGTAVFDNMTGTWTCHTLVQASIGPP